LFVDEDADAHFQCIVEDWGVGCVCGGVSWEDQVACWAWRGLD
jgi:hypothetical protein